MESIELVFTILIAILFSGLIGRFLPWGLPLPLIQIALGFVISGVFDEGILLNPEVFFLLLIPPLLFLDGWRIPKDELRRDKAGIFQLAFGLVIITVFGLGYIIHWMIPSMPLAVSFALAAIVSPTDPVAVQGITRRLPVPRRLMSILEGEALFNDASGLVAFRMAVLAAMTGVFSLTQAVTSFVWVAVAGITAGVATTWLLSLIHQRINRYLGEEQGSEILLSLLTPFAAYVVAEAIGGSGILSAVAAGLMMSSLELSGRISPMTRMRRTAMWDLLQFTLNGFMFILLGEQLPTIFNEAIDLVNQTGHHNPWWLLIYAAVISLALTAFRFIWVTICVYIPRLISRNGRQSGIPAWRYIFILSFAGVRGAVTLAGVMTLPFLLPDQSEFPGRDIAIFLAAAVIIISLIAASIVLPLLLKGVAPSQEFHISYTNQRKMAIQTAYEQAADHLKSLIDELDKNDHLDKQFYDEVKTRLLAEFVNGFRLEDEEKNLEYDKYLAERALRLALIDQARSSIFQLARKKIISDELARELVERLDFDHIRFT
ncbi:Na+/H+ antiporter [Advenella sp. WQ 585]|uniref:Na+/H+ antiporter n=1 Tax=Advenella mandrilli TaxID=2800330 RepID=A0ABS1EEZ9_9BURK|nr:Na+/H+ antiporter [Advenella mandrilli]MBK1781080.1 Na+/H+ antiporter [Advenella mandrilli]